MTNSPDGGGRLSPDQRALLAIRKLKARVQELEPLKREPIAVVGLGCRFPGGASDPAAYWEVLREGRDAVGLPPEGRRELSDLYHPDRQRTGTLYVREGAFLDRIDGFDARFFGIAPREALRMDPQQRLFLEVAWEALEHALIPPQSLKGSRTGVFVGATTTDYLQLHARHLPREQIDAYLVSGNTHHAMAGRLSHLLGLTGPAMAIDTACSSGLVAVERACRSLWDRESDAALAGGVSLMVGPDTYISFCRWGMVAPDGRCKTFDARADGFGRGEGCGVVVLKRLSDAMEAGDRVLALIRGSAVNQDGASSALSVPNGLAQEAVVREALERAGVEPGQVSYVEAHGTGTELGDPLEMEALAKVFGHSRDPGNPLLVGAVKTNIGHLEAAAGVAGLMKVVLALSHRWIPPHLHFETPSPKIDWDRIPLRVPTRGTPWPAGGGPRRAGVSAFGFSGTNVHLVVEEAPATPTPAGEEAAPGPDVHLLPLSAGSEQALRHLASRYVALLETEPDVPLGDLCFSAATGRSQLPHRLAVLGADGNEVRRRLEGFLAGAEDPGVVSGMAAAGERRRVAFLFSGQGAQYRGMGVRLLDTAPAFRAAMNQCDAFLGPHLGVPLRRLLEGAGIAEVEEERPGSVSGQEVEPAELLHRTEFTQPVLFAVEYALARLWVSWGVEPALVMGHSLGEFVSACLAGVMELEDALHLVLQRGQLARRMPAGGRMVVVRASEDEVVELLRRIDSPVAIAAVNGPENVVISGTGEAVEEVVTTLEAQGTECTELRISRSFHSPLVEPILGDFARALGEVELRQPGLRLLSNVTGREVGAEVADTGYWIRHMREPVRFSDAVATLLEMGVDTFLEVGPSPVLLGMGQHCVPEGFGHWLPSLRKDRGDWAQLQESLGRLWTLGVAVDWTAFHAPWSREKVSLPTYPFQRERYWLETEGGHRTGERIGIRAPLPGIPRPAADGHPLLGAAVASAGEERIHQVLLGARNPAYLGDHRVHGEVILPASAFLEMALAAGACHLGEEARVLEDVLLRRPLVLPGEGTIPVQVVLSDRGEGRARFLIASMAWAGPEEGNVGGGAWTLHATGTVRTPEADESRDEWGSLDDWKAACATELEAEDHYRSLRERGLDFGQAFRLVDRVAMGDGRSLVRASLPEWLADPSDGYLVHPSLLDSGLQAMEPTLPAQARGTFLPMSAEKVVLHRRGVRHIWSFAEITQGGPGSPTITGRVTLRDAEDRCVLQVTGLGLRPAVQARTGDPGPGAATTFHRVEWRRLPKPAGAPHAKRRFSPQVAFADPRDGDEGIHGALEAMAEFPEVRRLESFAPELERLAAAFIRCGLVHLGWRPGPSHGVDEEAEALALHLGVVPRHRRLLARSVAIARDASDEGEDPERMLDSLRERFPEERGVLNLAGRAGRSFADVLRGREDPLNVLFPGGDLADAQDMYGHSSLTGPFNRLLAGAVGRIVARHEPERALRVLEVGAGTGGTTAHLLELLPADRTEYLFTDVSPLFLQRARDRFSEVEFLRTALLDISRDPADQGFEPGSFDLVVAANVLHAAPDLSQAIAGVRSLLAPGGTGAFLEVVRAQAFADLTVGMTEGWWAFQDEGLRSQAILSEGEWRSFLGKQELGHVSVTAGEGVLGQQALILVRSPEAASGEDPPPETEEWEPGEWWVCGDHGGLGEELANRLDGAGARSAQVSQKDLSGDPPTSLGQAMGRAGPRRLAGVVCLWPLDHSGSPDGEARAEDGSPSPPGWLPGLLQLVRTLADSGEAPRVWVVTRGAHRVGEGGGVSPWQATVWGAVRVLAEEHPEFRPSLVDLDPDEGVDPSHQAAHLFEEVWARDEEDQIALRGGERLVPRLVPYAPGAAKSPAGDPSHQVRPAVPYRLVTSAHGSFEGLGFEGCDRRTLGAGEVEVEVVAAGLNFRDVLNALGEYPGGPVPFGGECSGVVSAVGAGVDGLRVGDPVVALAPGAFGSHVVAGADCVRPMPRGLSFPEAATIPAAYLTAWYALHTLAGLGSGERVLIHSAAGGVGTAAVRLAMRAGAEVFATAGSPAKRAVLRRWGVEHVMDSRSSSFREEVLRATGGEGVHVVLNSLSGDLAKASVGALSGNGRFIELGKREVWDGDRFASVRPHALHHPVDLAAAVDRDPRLIGELLDEVLAAVEGGGVSPLPLTPFPMERVEEAFRFMAQARHVGKIVLTGFDAPGTGPVRADATYLVAGGLGGLGLRVAQALVAEGARSLALFGRSDPSPEALSAVAELEAAGVRVRVMRGDVSSRKDVRRVLAAIRGDMPPLRGLVHAAGVLDEAGILQQSPDRFFSVLAPKTEGGWILHEETRHLAMDFFVLFSSGAALLGPAGLSSHAAACTFLDALAHLRRFEGLPSLSINWGQWAEVGAASGVRVTERLRDRGIRAMAPEEGVRAFRELLGSSTTEGQIAVVAVDWEQWCGSRSRAAPFLEEVLNGAPPSRAPLHGRAGPDSSYVPDPGSRLDPGFGSHPFRARFEQAPPARRRSLLLDHVRSRAARALGMGSASELDPAQPLQELGLDSLMAVELRNLLAAGLDLPRALPATLAYDHPTAAAMAEYLLQLLDGGKQANESMRPGNGAGGRDASSSLAGGSRVGEPGPDPDGLDAVSEAEAEALLAAELEALRKERDG